MLGRGGIFSHNIDLTGEVQTPTGRRKKVSAVQTTKKKATNSKKESTRKKTATSTARKPAKRRTNQEAFGEVLGDTEVSKKRKKPSTTTTTTTTPLKTDLNVKRNLPDKFLCNGRTVTNQFKPIVQDSNADQVIAYFSSYTLGTNKRWESNLVKGLVKMINTYGRNRTVVGCVAWLSNQEILTALQGCARVLLIVNREDYSKWGNGSMLDYYKRLPQFDIPLSVAFSHLDSPLGALETNRVKGKSKYSSVRAFGSSGFSPGRKGGSGGGLEHCKYLIFFEQKCFKKRKGQIPERWTLDGKIMNPLEEGEVVDYEEREGYSYDYQFKELPCAVWTGSMNMTKASETNHENAVFIKSSKVAMGYFHDFSNTFMVSTPVSSSKSSSGTPKKYVSMK